MPRLAGLVDKRLKHLGVPHAGAALLPAVALYKDRVHTIDQLADELMLVYADPHVPAELLREHVQGPVRDALATFAARAGQLDWNRAAISAAIKQLLGEAGLKMPQLAIPLRVAVSGRTQTPSIDALLEILGADTVVRRLQAALAATGP